MPALLRILTGMTMTNAEHEAKVSEDISRAPSFFRIVWREIAGDKLALISLIFLIALFMFVYIAAAGVDSESVVTVSLKKINKPPSAENILGTDPSGRDMYTQLVVGARNSISIAIGITLLCGFIGTVVGLFAGFYGGFVDNIVMRVIDFLSMLPTLMLVIVVVSVIPKYNVFTFTLCVMRTAAGQ